MVDVNCRAVLEQCFHFGRMFAGKGRGGIILMSSIAGFQGAPYAASYSATKAFVQSLAEGLHYELRRFGVDVLSVAPGPVHSGFARRAHMNMRFASTPSPIAAAMVNALGKRMTIRPALLSKLLGWPLMIVPRTGRVRIMASVMERMTRRGRSSES